MYEKLAIVDEYHPVDNCWMLKRDHHLDDRFSLSHVNRRQRPSVVAINDAHSLMARPRTSWQFYMTQVTKAAATSKENCPKNHFAPPPPIWRPLKISPPNVHAETHIIIMGQNSTITQISRRSARDICSHFPGKNTFPYNVTSLGVHGYRHTLYILRKLPSCWF